MSGENWNEFPHEGNNEIQNSVDEAGGAPGGDDDDFGEFEGFDVAHEIGMREAQPLPRALQVTWNNFPDYVPSQCASTGSLQPDLLPTTQSTSGTTSTSYSSQSLTLPDFSAAILQPPDVSSGHHVSSRQPAPHQPPHLDLADLHHSQDAASNDEGATGPQPDLADIEQSRSRNAFQAHYPDVSPQRASSSSSSASISSVSEHVRPQMLPDLSDFVLRQPSGAEATGRDVFAIASQVPMVATAPESSPSGSDSTYSSPPESKIDGEYLFPGRGVSYGIDISRGRGSHQVSPIVEQQLNLLRDQNHHLFREIGELKNQNGDLMRLLLQFLDNGCNSGKQNAPSIENSRLCCGDCTTVKSDLKSMASDLEHHESRMVSEIRQLLAEHRDLCTNQIEKQTQLFAEQLTEKKDRDDLAVSTIIKLLESQAINQEAVINSKLSAFREDLRTDLEKWSQSLSPNGLNNEHRFQQVLKNLEQAIQSLESTTEEQEKRNSKSLGLTVSMLDSLLAGARQQLRETFNPETDDSLSNS